MINNMGPKEVFLWQQAASKCHTADAGVKGVFLSSPRPTLLLRFKLFKQGWHTSPKDNKKGTASQRRMASASLPSIGTEWRPTRCTVFQPRERKLLVWL